MVRGKPYRQTKTSPYRTTMGISFLFLFCMSSILINTDPLHAATNLPEALQNLYMSLESPPQLTGWSSTGSDPCGESWKGVTCSGQSVTEIHLSGLHLKGNLGYTLDQLTSLIILDLSNNDISGDLPYQLPPNLQQLNLANNNFTGNFPYSFTTMKRLSYLNMSNNQLSGSMNDVFGHLQNLNTLDLSFNKLAGELPQSFSNLSELSVMHLQNNMLDGNLNYLERLSLQDLDVENNHFSGLIPSSLRSIPNLKLNGNNFNTFPAPPSPPSVGAPQQSPSPTVGESPSGNLIQQSSPINDTDVNNDKHSGLSIKALAGILVAGVFGVITATALTLFFCVKPKEKQSDEEKQQPVSNDRESKTDPLKLEPTEPCKMITSNELGKKSATMTMNESRNKSIAKRSKMTLSSMSAYSVADLQVATNSFNEENLLGEGSFGPVYKGQLDGKAVVVKKIDIATSNSDKNITGLISRISCIQHTNITQFLGYCIDYGQCLLVYEHVSKGCLHDLLHSGDETRKELTWNARVKIALGTARALEYLHEECSPPIIHKNFNSGNILLDEDLNPSLSDSGIAAFLEGPEQRLSTGSCHFSAPEHAMSGLYTTKSDVYSFGVVMLELLTGRKPFDSTRPRNEKSLVRWAMPQLHDIDALTSMMDPTLSGLYPVKSISRFADIVSLCVQPEPEFRPLMSEVVQSLVRLMQRASLSKKKLSHNSNYE